MNEDIIFEQLNQKEQDLIYSLRLRITQAISDFKCDLNILGEKKNDAYFLLMTQSALAQSWQICEFVLKNKNNIKPREGFDFLSKA